VELRDRVCVKGLVTVDWRCRVMYLYWTMEAVGRYWTVHIVRSPKLHGIGFMICSGR
jgi:hypothetical protein